MNLHEAYAGSEYGLFISENLLKAAPSKDPIIEHFLYERDCVCISSKAGVGKSVLALQLIASLTSGTPFLDTFRVAQPYNVLYVQTEGDRAETLERIELMGRSVPFDHKRWAHFNLPGIALNIENEFNAFIEAVRATSLLYDVIIIDPLYTTIKGDMNRNDVATDWIRNVRKLKAWCECAVIVLNHEGKDIYNEGQVVEKPNDAIFGSTFWAAFFNHNYRLRTVPGYHTLEIGKNRSGKAVDKITMKMMTEGTLAYSHYVPDVSQGTQRVIGLLQEGKPLSSRKLVEVATLSRAQMYRILRDLEAKEVIHRIETPSGETLFLWGTDEKNTLDKGGANGKIQAS